MKIVITDMAKIWNFVFWSSSKFWLSTKLKSQKNGEWIRCCLLREHCFLNRYLNKIGQRKKSSSVRYRQMFCSMVSQKTPMYVEYTHGFRQASRVKSVFQEGYSSSRTGTTLRWGSVCFRYLNIIGKRTKLSCVIYREIIY